MRTIIFIYENHPELTGLILLVVCLIALHFFLEIGRTHRKAQGYYAAWKIALDSANRANRRAVAAKQEEVKLRSELIELRKRASIHKTASYRIARRH